MVLLARTTPLEDVTKPSEGLSLFFIDFDKDAPGLELREIKKMGGRAVDANEVFFDNYRVSADSLIGKEGEGFKIVSLPNQSSSNNSIKLIRLLGPARHERRTMSSRRRGTGARLRRAGKSRGVRPGPRGVRSSDRAEPGDRAPAGHGVHESRGGETGDVPCRQAV